MPQQQQPNGADILATQAILVLLLLFAFYLGFYAAAKRWPNKTRPTFSDCIIALPISIFCFWILIPRTGLAGETIIPAWQAGNTSMLNSFCLSFGVMMIFGMAFQRVLPELEGPLRSIGSGIIGRLRFAAIGLISGREPSPGNGRKSVEEDGHKLVEETGPNPNDAKRGVRKK